MIKKMVLSAGMGIFFLVYDISVSIAADEFENEEAQLLFQNFTGCKELCRVQCKDSNWSCREECADEHCEDMGPCSIDFSPRKCKRELKKEFADEDEE